MPPLGMALLVETKGDAGLPLGTAVVFGTGDARVGGDVGTPLGEAAAVLSAEMSSGIVTICILAADKG